MARNKNRYTKIIEAIFDSYFKKGAKEVPFNRSDIVDVARELGIRLPKNLGDVLYTFRYRADLPESIRKKAPPDFEWVIRPAGRSKYQFVLISEASIVPSSMLAETKIPDSTPGIIEKYALNDEQALLAKLRYNRLIDIFTGLTCYSLQSHLRTSVSSIGQVETDEIYIGIDKRGAHYVLPIQAKGGKDKLGIVQIEQDLAICSEKFPDLICLPIAAQFMKGQVIALFLLEQTETGVAVASEKHYRLVSPDELSEDELLTYKTRLE